MNTVESDLELFETLSSTSIFKGLNAKGIEVDLPSEFDASTSPVTDYDGNGRVSIKKELVIGRAFVMAHELSHIKNNDKGRSYFYPAVVVFGLVYFFASVLDSKLGYLCIFLFPSLLSYFDCLKEFRCDREGALAIVELGFKTGVKEAFEYLGSSTNPPSTKERNSLIFDFITGQMTHPPIYMRIDKIKRIEEEFYGK